MVRDLGKQGLPSSSPRDNVSKRVYKYCDFSHEYVSKRVLIKLANNTSITATLLEASKYWFKISVNGKAIYVNKAWVVAVEPLQ